MKIGKGIRFREWVNPARFFTHLSNECHPHHHFFRDRSGAKKRAGLKQKIILRADILITKMKRIVFIFLFLLSGYHLLRAEKIEPDSVLAYEDRSHKMTIKDIVAKADFVSVNDFNFGYSTSAHWLKIPVKDYFQKQPYCIAVQQPTIYEVDFFLMQNDSLIEAKSVGLLRPQKNQGLSIGKYFLEVTPLPVEQTVYLRFKESGASLRTNICFQPLSDFLWDIHKSIALFYLYIGVSSLILFYGLFNYYKQRKRLFLFYSGFVFFSSVFQGFNLGFFHLFLPDLLAWVTNQLRFFLLTLMFISWLLYSYYMLAIKVTENKFAINTYKALFILLALLIFSNFFVVQLDAYKYYIINTFYATCSFAIGFVLYCTMMSMRNGHRPARYFLFGQFPILSIYSLFLLRNYGLFPHFNFFSILPLVFMLFEMVVMFACMEKYYRQEDSIKAAVEEASPQETVLELLSQKTIASGTKNDEISPETLALYSRVRAFFEAEKPYLNSNLKLSDVSEKIGIPAYQISISINSCSNMHFFDFVNSYRVEVAKEMLADEEMNRQFTIEHIATQAGFNSKTSFYSAFKKFTGVKPSHYKTKEA